MIDQQLTDLTRRRYERLAGIYDRYQALMERRFRPFRARLWAQVRGPCVLEVGVGTGKNIPFYPVNVEVTAIDLSPRMLLRAEERAARHGRRVDLRVGDMQELDFPDGFIDEAVATFVFYSVPDPVLGLAKIHRVLKPGGRLLMLEHVRAANALLGLLMDLANPVVVRLMGANINRRTVETVQRGGWELERVETLDGLGIENVIHARKAA